MACFSISAPHSLIAVVFLGFVGSKAFLPASRIASMLDLTAASMMLLLLCYREIREKTKRLIQFLWLV